MCVCVVCLHFNAVELKEEDELVLRVMLKQAALNRNEEVTVNVICNTCALPAVTGHKVLWMGSTEHSRNSRAPFGASATVNEAPQILKF